MRWHQIAESQTKRGGPRPAIPVSGLRHRATMQSPTRARDNRSARHVNEAGTIKPTGSSGSTGSAGSLDAEEWRKRSERQARVQQQIRDEDARHATKKRDLRARLARPG